MHLRPPERKKKMIQQQIGEIPKEKVQQIVRERLVKIEQETGFPILSKIDRAKTGQ